MCAEEFVERVLLCSLGCSTGCAHGFREDGKGREVPFGHLPQVSPRCREFLSCVVSLVVGDILLSELSSFFISYKLCLSLLKYFCCLTSILVTRYLLFSLCFCSYVLPSFLQVHAADPIDTLLELLGSKYFKYADVWYDLNKFSIILLIFF